LPGRLNVPAAAAAAVGGAAAAAAAACTEGRDACYIAGMATAAESVELDDDVGEELRKLAESSGRPLSALANDALRDFLRYERSVAAAIERGIADLDAGRTRTTDEVRTFLEEQRLARGRG